MDQLSCPLTLTIGFVAYLIIWIAGFGDFYNVEFLLELKSKYNLTGWNDFSIALFHIIMVGSINFIISFPSILGEEIGWRGLLFNELSQTMTFKGVALTSGIAWSIFHWPLIFKGLYGNNVTPIFYQLAFFSLFIISSTVIITYIRIKSGSLWTAVVYHASSNIFIQKVFTPMTLKNEKSFWYIDEFGAILAMVTFGAAIYFWIKGIDEFNKFEEC